MASGWARTSAKSPAANLDYQVDYQYWMEDGDTIASSEWELEAGVAKTAESFGDDNTTVWLSGGTDGNDYDIRNRIVTAGGRKRDLTFVLVVRQR